MGNRKSKSITLPKNRCHLVRIPIPLNLMQFQVTWFYAYRCVFCGKKHVACYCSWRQIWFHFRLLHGKHASTHGFVCSQNCCTITEILEWAQNRNHNNYFVQFYVHSFCVFLEEVFCVCVWLFWLFNLVHVYLARVNKNELCKIFGASGRQR